MNNIDLRIKKICDFMGWEFYIGDITGEPRMIYKNLHSGFNPFQNVRDALIVIWELQKDNPRFYFSLNSSYQAWSASIYVLDHLSRPSVNCSGTAKHPYTAITYAIESYINFKTEAIQHRDKNATDE